jgi:hypothetical protein
MFVWGGFDARGNEQNVGALYDPATDRWRPVPSAGAPSPRAFFAAVAAGPVVVVWGGSSSDRSTIPAQVTRTETGAVFDPDLFAWREIDTLGAPARRNDTAAVWTGSEMLLWGGAGALGRLATGGLLQP